MAAALWAAPARARQAGNLEALLRERIESSGAVVGLYLRDLTRPLLIEIGSGLRFHAASTMKIAVMIQVFRDVDAGLLSLGTRLPVRNSFRSIADGSEYSLSPTDDSDSSLYREIGRTVTVQRLVELMITVSSNLATNILIERVGAERVQATVRELGADSMEVRRGVEDGPAFRAGLNNTTTARDLGMLLGALVEGRAASARSCGAMLRILLGQRFRDAIPAGLPRGTRVAHKTGTITALHHDAGIVYADSHPRYVLVVLTRGIEDQSRAASLIAELAGLAHRGLVTGPPPGSTPPRP